MHTYAQRLMSERDHLTDMATDTAERAAAEDRDLTDTEQASIDGWQKRCGEIDVQLQRTNEQMESTRAWANLRQRLGELDNPREENNLPARRTASDVVETRSWGDAFVQAEEFRSWHGGRGAPVDMPFGLLEERAAADPITTTTLPIQPALYEPREPTWANPLLAAVGREPVASNSVEWIRWQPPQPPPVSPTPEGTLKPALDVTPEEKAVTLDTYAVWKAITRQALEDYPRIRAIVEGFLRQSLMRSLEEAIATAISSDTDVPSVGATGTPLLASVRAAMAQVEVNGFTANTILVNVEDWAAMDVATSIGANIIPGVQRGFWGLGVVGVPQIPAGTAWVGDMRSAVTLFDRNRTNVYLTDSHNQNFLRNILVVLAETRAYAAVTNPTAMCKAVGDGNACLECTDGTVNVPSLPELLTQPASTSSTTTTTTGP